VLPLGAGDEAEAQAGRHEGERELADVPVLVVDDDRDSLDLISAILRDAGASVRTASSVSQAVDAFRQEPPRLVVSDIGMPETDGYALVRRIQEEHAAGAPAVPCVAVTAYARAEDRTNAIERGFSSYVQKPVDAGRFVSVLRALLPHT
jgi:CheY-like chemotaxis protein